MSYLQKFDELTLSKCKEMTKPEQMALNTLALGGVKPSSNGGFVVAKPISLTALGEFLSMRGMQVTDYPTLERFANYFNKLAVEFIDLAFLAYEAAVSQWPSSVGPR